VFNVAASPEERMSNKENLLITYNMKGRKSDNIARNIYKKPDSSYKTNLYRKEGENNSFIHASFKTR
jgi:hypothetical protein